MEDYARANALIEKDKLKWITVNFLDIMSGHRSISLPASSFLESKAWESVDFDGSSVGLATVDKSDMALVPDPKTLIIDPFSEDNTGMLMASIKNADGEMLGPRSGLERMLKEYDDRGMCPHISPEMEFYVFRSIGEALLENDFMGTDIDGASKNLMHSFLGIYDKKEYPPKSKQSYLSSIPTDDLRAYRDRLSGLLLDAGYGIRYHHHEAGRRQIEIETGYYPATQSADFVVNFKYFAKVLAKDFGLLPTFMPKPSAHDAGNGMHFHIRVMKGEKNAFNNDGELSDVVMHFIAGLMEHAPALCAFTNPTINSYRRLMPGYEAPVVVAWSRSNRSALIRVPSSSKGESNNIEIRNPDPSCNPYFALTVILAAGLDGVKKKMSPPEESVGNLYKENGAPTLPATLKEALDASARDELIVNAIGEELFDIYRTAKEKEIAEYRKHVPIWDFNMYYGV